MVDQIFTPPQIAGDLLDFVSARICDVVCDTAAGGGALLESASKRFKTSRLIGFDSDISCVAKLKQLGFESGKRDVLSRYSKVSSKLCNEISGTVDLALLNPPFSSVGCKHFVYPARDVDLKVTLPMYFLIDSFELLKVGGIIACVLPSGMVDREADLFGWQMLGECGTIKISNPTTYDGWGRKITTVFAEIKKTAEFRPSKRNLQGFPAITCGFDVVRGRLRNSRDLIKYGGSIPFVHSTELVDGKIDFGRLIQCEGLMVCSGPCVLIPRVGMPKSSKICVLENGNSVILSDCVISIRTHNSLRAHEIRDLIQSEWDSFQSLYKGTCARHITVRRIQAFLRSKTGSATNGTVLRGDFEGGGHEKPGGKW